MSKKDTKYEEMMEYHVSQIKDPLERMKARHQYMEYLAMKSLSNAEESSLGFILIPLTYVSVFGALALSRIMIWAGGFLLEKTSED